MKRSHKAWAFALMAGMLGVAWAASTASAAVDPDAEPAPPPVPQVSAGGTGVKEYLLAVIASSRSGAADLRRDAGQYADLCKQYGSPAAAAAAQPVRVGVLIHRCRNDYKRVDSFGYEYMEGIVAGVPELIKYDVELDSGVPMKGAGVQDQVADITLDTPDERIDKDGSLNNFLIEPTVYGTNPRFVATPNVSLPGYSGPINLPKPGLLVALADYAVAGYARLDHDARRWQPNDRTLFQAMFNMTPTLSGYFDDWKEAKKYGGSLGGRFVAVSRVSDMRGIMASTRLNWVSMEPKVTAKDPALSEQISKGYNRVMQFIDTIDARDQRRPLAVQTIDALGEQAKERADKLTVEVSQAAAELGLDVNGK